MEQARAETLRRGSQLVTVGDMLAGLAWEEGTRADRIAGLKTNAMYLRWLVGLPSLPEEHPADMGHETDLDIGVRIALAYAMVEADRDGDSSIGTDHLVRGLLRFPNMADFALLKTEVSLESMREGSRLDREESFAADAPRLQAYGYRVRRFVAQRAPTLVGIACYLYLMIEGVAMSQPASPK